jgi:hypothetical protein
MKVVLFHGVRNDAGTPVPPEQREETASARPACCLSLSKDDRTEPKTTEGHLTNSLRDVLLRGGWVRLCPELEAALDAWIGQQPEPKPSRAEAKRRLLRDALSI